MTKTNAPEPDADAADDQPEPSAPHKPETEDKSWPPSGMETKTPRPPGR